MKLRLVLLLVSVFTVPALVACSSSTSTTTQSPKPQAPTPQAQPAPPTSQTSTDKTVETPDKNPDKNPDKKTTEPASGATPAAPSTPAPTATPAPTPAPVTPPAPPTSASLTDSVNPFVGTGAGNAKGGVPGGLGGGAQPAAVVPFGMVEIGPDTDHPEQSGYDDGNSAIRGFSMTHLSGPGCKNTGELPFLPFIGQPKWPAVGTGIAFSHADQLAAPGFYRVALSDGSLVELTATERTGMARLTFAKAGAQNVGAMFNTNVNGLGVTTGSMHVIDDRHFGGNVRGGKFCGSKTSYDLFYVIEFEHAPIVDIQATGISTFTFPNVAGQSVLMKIGISYVSEANAALNLKTENATFDFDQTHQAAKQSWERALGTVRVAGSATPIARSLFYTALYHTLLHPNLASDVNGAYMGFDFKPHVDATRPHYHNFSGWDIYRSQVQLIAALFPKRASDIAQSLVDEGAQCGALPKWAQANYEANVMVGDPGSVILANLFAFGATAFDTKTALALMTKSANDPTAACQGHIARPGLASYLSHGYVPNFLPGVWGPAATSLEYATADYAIAKFAAAQGDKTNASSLLARSAWWKNLWDASVQGIRPKSDTGIWVTPFDPASKDGFVEGNSAQYSWMIPFDGASLVKAFGGDQAATAKLDQFLLERNAGLASPHLYIGNEPGFGTPWMYLWSHAPSHAQSAIRDILVSEFRNEVGGLPGNDDLGAMSSWYVWAALGFYPEIPGVGGVVVGSPSFSDVSITPEGSTTYLHIVAPGAEMLNYVAAVTIDGQAWSSTWIPWSRVQSTAEIRFDMNRLPQAWGSHVGDEPPSN